MKRSLPPPEDNNEKGGCCYIPLLKWAMIVLILVTITGCYSTEAYWGHVNPSFFVFSFEGGSNFFSTESFTMGVVSSHAGAHTEGIVILMYDILTKTPKNDLLGNLPIDSNRVEDGIFRQELLK